jgi:hypothetical protein
VFELAGDAHAGSQVARADKNPVNPIDFSDGLDLCERLHCFHLDQQTQLVVAAMDKATVFL